MPRHLLASLILFAGMVSDLAGELKVERSLWGFGGRPLNAAFSPLTLEVTNTSDKPYTGTILLEEVVLGNQVNGAPQTQPFSIGPRGRRTVQFYVYHDSFNQQATWKVKWLGGVAEIAAPSSFAGREIVQLIDEDDITSGSMRFAAFPARYFPTSASATRSLAVAVLDHTPDWEPAKAESFRQWLYRGGALHLFRQVDGSWPSLEWLADSENVGHGQVTRHDKTLRDLTPADAKALQPKSSSASFGKTRFSRRMVTEYFARLTRPDLPWGLLYGAAFVYILLQGPGHLLISRRIRDYRFSIVILLLTIGLFSWVFAKLGKRGYGETTQYRALSFARPVGPELYDVEHWSFAFVTEGDDYTFKFPAKHQLFQVQGAMERVPGTIQNGFQGQATLDMPVFSSRSLTSAAILPGPDIRVQVRMDGAGEPEFQVSGRPEIEFVYFGNRDNVYTMSHDGGDVWRKGHTFEWAETHRIYDRNQLNSLAVKWMNSRPGFHNENGTELYIGTKTPDTFFPTSPKDMGHHGFTIYVIDVTHQLEAALSTP